MHASGLDLVTKKSMEIALYALPTFLVFYVHGTHASGLDLVTEKSMEIALYALPTFLVFYVHGTVHLSNTTL